MPAPPLSNSRTFPSPQKEILELLAVIPHFPEVLATALVLSVCRFASSGRFLSAQSRSRTLYGPLWLAYLAQRSAWRFLRVTCRSVLRAFSLPSAAWLCGLGAVWKPPRRAPSSRCSLPSRGSRRGLNCVVSTPAVLLTEKWPFPCSQ